MKLGQGTLSLISKTEIGKKIVNDRYYRIVLSATFALIGNLLYACYHGILGIMNVSLWFVTMCAFYGILAAMRFSAVLYWRRNVSASSADTEYFVMKLSGILLIILSFILAVVNYISLSQNIAVKHNEIMMIAIAAYTFYKVSVAVAGAIKRRVNPSPLFDVVRRIRYAEVAASVLTLQRSMLVSFGAMENEKIHMMNALTGAAVCLFVCILGIFMTMRAIKKG